MPPVSTHDQCPICLRNAKKPVEPDFATKNYPVECLFCGDYTITEELFDDIQDLIGDLRPNLIAAAAQASDAGSPLTLDLDNWREHAELHRHVSVRAKIDMALRLIRRRTEHPGARASITPEQDYPLTDAANGDELVFLLTTAERRGYLEMGPSRHFWYLTAEGLDYIDPTSAGGVRGYVFVAMSFDRSLDEAFDLGIKPAIEKDCQLDKAERVDKEHHNEKICDKILADIRRCQFMVADYTQHKGGVYFEDGFALGLGRTVIRCCRDDDFNFHFDTRQYPHIKWNTPADLRRQLAEKIQALGLAGQKRT